MWTASKCARPKPACSSSLPGRPLLQPQLAAERLHICLGLRLHRTLREHYRVKRIIGFRNGFKGLSQDSRNSVTELTLDAVRDINNGGGTGGKSKADLLADGYTCTTLSGTTVTLCWKNGSPGYTCNDRGTCTQNAKPVAPPIVTLPPRSPGVVLAP